MIFVLGALSIVSLGLAAWLHDFTLVGITVITLGVLLLLRSRQHRMLCKYLRSLQHNADAEFDGEIAGVDQEIASISQSLALQAADARWTSELARRREHGFRDHPLILTLSQPEALKHLSPLELMQRVLTIIAGSTRAQAAAIVHQQQNNSLNVVGYGLKSLRFEKQLIEYCRPVLSGELAALGLHDSFSEPDMFGGFATFGCRHFALHTLRLGDDIGRIALWIGYRANYQPTMVDYEHSAELLKELEGSIARGWQLATLDGKADLAKAESDERAQALAQVSHDIRSPLANIKAILQLLQLDERDAEKADLAAVALRNCEELGELVSDVIDFTRARAGALDGAEQQVDVVAAAQRVVSNFAVNAKLKNIELVFKSVLPSAFIAADPGHLKRVLTNLISNALKYTAVGSVRVSVALGARDTVMVSVADSGLGMSKEQIDKLFSPFIRFHRSQADGIGLGLAITKLLTERYHGTVTVRSQESIGSEFIVTFPLVAATAMPTYEHNALGLRVLLVDDDADCVQTLARALAQRGCVVTTSHGVIECSQKITQQAFDFVITDLSMPGGGGRAVLDVCHKHAPTSAVIVLSGEDDERLKKELIARGAVAVLQKPVEISELCALLTSSARISVAAR